MGAINYGNQTIAFDYNQAGKAETFNKINYELFPIGIYNGGLLTYVNTTTIQVATFNSFIEDSANKLGVSLKTEDVVNISVAPSTPYIVIQFSWDNSDNNYADIVAVDYASVNADDLIIGKCAYNTSNVLQTTFDYTRRTVSSLQNLDNKKDNLKVIAQEPYANTVYVNSGELIIDGSPISFSAQSSPTLSDTTLGRIDLVYIDEVGTLSILEGVDSGSPVTPTFPLASIVLGIITRGAGETVIRGDQIVSYNVDRESTDVSSATDAIALNTIHRNTDITDSVSAHGIQQGSGNGFDADTLDGIHKTEILATTAVYNITTASNETHALPDATTVENQHIVKRRGDGNGIVTFTTEDSQTIDTESSTELTLEGESSVILIPKSGNWESVKTGGAVAQVSGELSETIAIRNLVYFDNSGTLSIGDKGELGKSILAGFLTKAGVITDIRYVQSSGLLDGFTGLIEGTQYFLGDAGAIVTKGAINYEDYIVSVGVAVSTTELDVSIRLPEPTRNQDDGNPVGSIKYFSTYKDRSAYGYLPFAFDNALSQANYPVLYAEIGDIYEAQHVAAGDSASGAGMFYPTPVPGAYDRVGIPDETYLPSDVNIASNYFDIVGLKTGLRDGIAFKIVGDDVPAGLVSDTVYYLRFLSTPDRFYFHPTEADAIAATNIIDITDVGSGTFRLTQEGIVLDDAFQVFNLRLALSEGSLEGSNEGKNGTGSAGNLRFSKAVGSGDVFGVEVEEKTSNGTPRTTNETRPKTNYSFGYIKAEHVTSAGEPISALRYDTGWVANSDWTDVIFTISHNLNANLSGLNIKLLFSTDGTEANSFETLFETIAKVGDSVWGAGATAMQTSINEFTIQTGAAGITLDYPSGGVRNVIDGESWYYKVVVTKPNLINTIFDTSTMPKSYDLTSANVTKTLPEITSAMQTVSWYWDNGGTYKLTPAVTDGATIDGIAPNLWLGEGKGHMLVESDGLNWQVREYEDRIDDSGKIYTKLLNGDMTYKGWGALIGAGTNTIADTGSMTRFVSLNNIKGTSIGAKANPAPSNIVDLDTLINDVMITTVSTITTWQIRLYQSAGTFSNTHHYGYGIEIEGRWKT